MKRHRQHSRSIARIALEGSILLAAALLVAPAPAVAFDDSEVKAVYLYNFATFIDWPDEAFPDRHAPIRYCVPASHPVHRPLSLILDGEIVDGRPLELRGLDDLPDDAICHVLFIDREHAGIADDDHGQLSRIVATVSDTRDFARRGGMIGLINEGARVTLEVNRAAIDRSRLRVSSKLLRVAREVDETKEARP